MSVTATPDDLLDIMTEASYRLNKQIKEAYKSGKLEEYLYKIGMLDLLRVEETPGHSTNPSGKILIIGASMLKEKDIYGCLKALGVDKSRIELLDYKDAKSFDFGKKIQFRSDYRLILFGPVPHSGKSKSDKSSIITQIESEDGYPKVIRLTDAQGLKITKTNLKDAISTQIQMGYIAV